MNWRKHKAVHKGLFLKTSHMKLGVSLAFLDNKMEISTTVKKNVGYNGVYIYDIWSFVSRDPFPRCKVLLAKTSRTDLK